MSWPALVSELAFVLAMLLLVCPLLLLPQRLRPAPQQKRSASVGDSSWN